MKFYPLLLLLSTLLASPVMAEQHAAQTKGVVEAWSALQNTPTRAATRAFIANWPNQPLYRALAQTLLATLPEDNTPLAPAPALTGQIDPPPAAQPVPESTGQALPAPAGQVVLPRPTPAIPLAQRQATTPPRVDSSPAPRPEDTPPQAQAALAFLQLTIEDLSRPDIDLGEAVKTYYASRIQFYGNDWSQAQVIADKRGFFARWPVRRYAMIPERTTISCADSICAIEAEVNFTAESPARQASSRGLALFNYVIDMRQTPLIALETSTVLERY